MRPPSKPKPLLLWKRQKMALVFIFLGTFCILMYPNSFTAIAMSTNTLTLRQKLTDGQTLVSSNQQFELGFFSPSNQTKTRYLGLWYKNISQFTVIWVARTKPLRHSSPTLKINLNGSLVIRDHKRVRILISRPGGRAHDPVLQLSDSGNLILKDGNGGYTWQSFDEPCNTLLPGMRIGWDNKNRINKVITSWKDTDDPSDGDFTLGIDKPELPQLVLMRKSSKESRWGPWKGFSFSGIESLRNNRGFKPILEANSDGVYFKFDQLDESVPVRLVVTELGKVQFLKWEDIREKWITVFTLNQDICDGYGSCGPNGVCYNAEPNCRCLDGFANKLSRDLVKMDNTDGCQRKFDLNCSDGDGFVRYKGLKIPDNGTVWPNIGYEECEMKCLKECKCMAYAYMNVYGNGSVCVVWLEDLFDMRSCRHCGGGGLYIRMARAELERIASMEKAIRRNLMIIVVISSVAGLALTCLVVVSLFKCLGRGERNISRNCRRIPEETTEFRLFDIETISAATGNFSDGNKIGEGGFGPVYKGILPNGQYIAVKTLSKSSRQGDEQFENETSLIARLQHRNLVKLLGYCAHGVEKMLIYEYLPNTSLDNFIFVEERRRLVPWPKRFDIILGVAKGLLYLHDDSDLKIVHRDLKASNILLDREMTPKISDFGLAKILGEDNGDVTHETTTRVVGTHGYVSPEYAMHGHFSTSSDVFSFGVLVLEIVSGKRNWGFQHNDHGLNLIGHGWNLWKSGRALELVDSAVKDAFCESEVLKCIQVGLLCVQHRAEVRPVMSKVVYLLGNEIREMAEPIEPGFYPGTSTLGFDAAGTPRSANGLTITTLSGR